MIHLYHFLGLCVVAIEAFSLHALTFRFLHRPRFHPRTSSLVPAAVVFLTAVIADHLFSLSALKMLWILGSAFGVLLYCYRDSLFSIAVALEVWFTFSIMLPERILLILTALCWRENLFYVSNGVSNVKWELYLLSILTRLLIVSCVYTLLNHFCCQIEITDLIILTIDFLLILNMFFISLYLSMHSDRTALYLLDIVIMAASFIFMIYFLYSKNMRHLREQDKTQIAQLHQQYSYYKDKLEDEEKIRSIYHDMKNHLLVLEASQNSEISHKMAKKLYSEISAYDNYIHTGNEFLDIIIREKAAVAKEKGIDFHILAHFEDGAFLDALDISTIFGNALDNAIEASEKLPQEQRLITVKAERKQDMLVIIVGNHTCSELPASRRSNKANPFFHGFGLPNIRTAAEKYGGQCSAKIENGIFTLKLVLPIP